MAMHLLATDPAGKHYFEALMTDEGLCRVGWSTPAGKLDLGTDSQGYGFGGTGKKSFNRAVSPRSLQKKWRTDM